MWKKYHTVTTIQEALTLLAHDPHHSRIVAGGTDLLLEIERGKRPTVDTLIDISRVIELMEIRLHEGRFHLGAMVTHNQVVADSRLQQYAIPLVQACWEVGAPQIRNRATLVGNVVTASPANDTITPLMALNARVMLASVRGQRTVALPDFYDGFRSTVLQSDEMVIGIEFDALPASSKGVFIKLGLRRAQAISVVNVAAILDFDGETIRTASITMGSVAPTIIHLPEVEQFLVGKSLTDEIMREVGRMARHIPQPISDIRSTAEYRIEMVGTLLYRALRQLQSPTAYEWQTNPTLLMGQSSSPATLDESVTHTADQPIQTSINGQPYQIATGQHKTLLDWIREDAHLLGTKEGCAEGECGACTVYLDGAAVMACMVPAPRAHLATVTTIEGLQNGEALHPLQQQFIEQGAVQCGFCTPGFVMAGAKLLEEHPHPTHDQIMQSISGNLCRCTGYYKIIHAIRSVGEYSKEELK
ncbi:MAG: FAD binding domain-containing protein [Phototrophicaceae bacterium]